MLSIRMEISICRITLHQWMWKSVLSNKRGGALAVSWALDNACLFVLECPNLIIVTDINPFLRYAKIGTQYYSQPQIAILKEKTLVYYFTIHYCPEKWHQGPDAVFHHPAHQIIPSYDPHTQKDWNYAYAIENQNKEVISQSLRLTNESSATPHSTITNIDNPVITTPQLQNNCKEDPTYQLLTQTFTLGFPKMKNDLPNTIRPFWEVTKQLSVSNKIILMDGCLVIPNNLRKKHT